MDKPLIKQHRLSVNHYIYGNEGGAWSNEAHIAKMGGDSNTLCGTPILVANWARQLDVTEAGCPECIDIYMDNVYNELANSMLGDDGEFNLWFVTESNDIADDNGNGIVDHKPNDGTDEYEFQTTRIYTNLKEAEEYMNSVNLQEDGISMVQVEDRHKGEVNNRFLTKTLKVIIEENTDY